MEEWKRLVRDTVDTPEKLAAALDVDLEINGRMETSGSRYG
jgi:hypothetical protein